MISDRLSTFEQHQPLRQRILHVFDALPTDVQLDLANDPRFTIALDNYVPGEGSTVFMAAPGGAGDGSRSVILKPKLSNCKEAFAFYVIAHEFAHAYLRNGPWGEITNVEEAADALAASWGFKAPQGEWRLFFS
ncbi:MAG: hypothetical protein NXI22_20830 [bacterium]|nr:hypothetical protein [bacterium]